MACHVQIDMHSFSMGTKETETLVRNGPELSLIEKCQENTSLTVVLLHTKYVCVIW